MSYDKVNLVETKLANEEAVKMSQRPKALCHQLLLVCVTFVRLIF